jgi:membrane protein DedA with SNARE-associated domain
MKFNISEKAAFFLKNFLKGLAWFGIIILGYVIIKHYFGFSYEHLLEPYLNNSLLIFSIYSLSEILFGIIPPEFFMIWGLRFNSVSTYLWIVFLLAVISYIAGFIGFLFGAYLNTTLGFRYVRKRFLGKYHSLLNKYGAFLIIVASMTPLPYSAISMLVGSLKFPMKNYLLYALTRFVRYGFYALIVWEANKL